MLVHTITCIANDTPAQLPCTLKLIREVTSAVGQDLDSLCCTLQLSLVCASGYGAQQPMQGYAQPQQQAPQQPAWSANPYAPLVRGPQPPY